MLQEPSEEKEQEKEKHSPYTRTSEIKCFKYVGRDHIVSQCPTKKTIILRVMYIY